MPIPWENNIVFQTLCLKRPAEDSFSYLQRLWAMDCPVHHFVEAARAEGLHVRGIWDGVPQMPVLVYLH